MRVHLLKSEELAIEKYLNVVNLLKQFKGPIEFVESESAVELHSLQTRIWQKEEDFGRQERFFSLFEDEPPQENKISFPHKEKFHSWDYFFMKCEQFRKAKAIPENDRVFLLTDHGNEQNWFGSIGPSNSDYFIQTSGWQHFFGSQVDERFPIAYELAIWLIRSLMFEQREAILEGVHMESRGCGNDFCQDKKDIILKMRTADLCPSCMGILEQSNASPLIINQLFSVMDGIRSSMTFRSRMKIMKRPSRLEIRGYTKRIFLADLGDLELNFNPKERAIYLFYLNHPEGVHFTALQDHKAEIQLYYERFTGQTEPIEIERSINRLLDPLDNDINVVLSRIKRKLKDAVGEDLLSIYQIDGPHGGDKRILLDREFVRVEND